MLKVLQIKKANVIGQHQCGIFKSHIWSNECILQRRSHMQHRNMFVYILVVEIISQSQPVVHKNKCV